MRIAAIITSIGLSLAAYLWLALRADRSAFAWLIGVFALLFVLYGVCMRWPSARNLKWVLMLGLCFRSVMFLDAPRLSDDYHRFVWDGRCMVAGNNPYQFTPSEYLEQHSVDDPDMHALYAAMNSPHYRTVYPPLHQAAFAAAVAASSTNAGAVNVMRLVLLFADTLVVLLLVLLLPRFKRQSHEVGWYVLNPLVIVETTGNVHFEVLVVACLLLSLYAGVRARESARRMHSVAWWALCTLGFVAAVLTKVSPLLLLPLVSVLLLRRFNRYGLFLSTILAAVVVLFLTRTHWFTIVSGISVFVQHFEFNGSIYYLARAALTPLVGYNPIAFLGPALSLFGALLIIALAVRMAYRMKNPQTQTPVLPMLVAYGLMSWMVYLGMATTVHPWYVMVPFAFSVLLGAQWRLALSVWSFSVLLSYSHYSGGGFSECYPLIALGYLLPIGAVLSVYRTQRSTG
jgi:hypothetical protein